MREHQFGKVEIVSINYKDQSKNEFDSLYICESNEEMNYHTSWRDVFRGPRFFIPHIRLIFKI